jgi:hypothetical protein
MGTDITMIDIKMNTNLDKWYKITKTRVIDEETAKKLRKLMKRPKGIQKKRQKTQKKI